MVTRRQIKSLKAKILKDSSEINPAQIDEVELYFINDDGSLTTQNGEVISKEEYKRILEEERAAGEKIIEIEC
jgi:hypothetical protein